MVSAGRRNLRGPDEGWTWERQRGTKGLWMGDELHVPGWAAKESPRVRSMPVLFPARPGAGISCGICIASDAAGSTSQFCSRGRTGPEYPPELGKT